MELRITDLMQEPHAECSGDQNVRDEHPELERVMRIELTYEAWEAAVLPLNYTRTVPDYRDPQVPTCLCVEV